LDFVKKIKFFIFILADSLKPSRAHCLTIQAPFEDPDWDTLNELAGGHLRFAVWQLESAPSTGQLHFQAYCEWSKTVRGGVFARWASVPSELDSDVPWCSGIHVEQRRGTREQAREYCEVAIYKDEEKGRLDGPWYWNLAGWDQGGQGRRSDFAAAVDLIAGGGSIMDVAKQFPASFVRYERGLARLGEVLAPPVFRDVEGWYIWGDTGVGKSHWVYSTFGVANVYAIANESPLWFDGYAGEPVLFFEEFESLVSIKTLLRIVDGYPLRVPVKGGFIRAQWTRVIITGNYDVTPHWPPELKRRFGFPLGRGDHGNVRHCRLVGERRLGFPSASEVGGLGGFPVVRVPHVVPTLGASGVGSDHLAASDSADSDHEWRGLLAGLDISLEASGSDVSGGGGGELVAPPRILPNFVLDGGVVRHSPLCSDPDCAACI